MSKPHSIAVISRTPEVYAETAACLAETKGKLLVQDGASFAAAASIVLIDQRQLSEPELSALLSSHADRCILLTERDDSDNINKVLAQYPVSHLIGGNGRSWAREVAATVRKVLTPAWGLSAYMSPSAVIESRTVKAATAIDPTIDELLGHVDLRASFEAAEQFLRQTANELLTNAVYNAPVDRQTLQPKYEQTDRREKVELLPDEAVEIAFATDADMIGIAVSDQFGRLSRDKIVRHLVKCVNNVNFIEEKKGGAGAGLYLAFYTANQFIVTVAEGQRTEILCLLEKTKRYKHHRTRVTSFNYFTQAKGAA